jgi:hypothetical protein
MNNKSGDNHPVHLHRHTFELRKECRRASQHGGEPLL